MATLSVVLHDLLNGDSMAGLHAILTFFIAPFSLLSDATYNAIAL